MAAAETRVATMDYGHLLAAAKADPLHADYAAPRAAYAASPGYSPLAGLAPETRGEMLLSMAAGDWRTALAKANAILGVYWLDIQAHMTAAGAAASLADSGAASLHRAAAAGLLSAVVSSGDGRSPATALVVINAGEERALIGALGARATGRRLVRLGGHAYDRIGVTGEQGEAGTIFFNVDAPLGGHAAPIAGRPPD
jgi:hypothetical protein